MLFEPNDMNTIHLGNYQEFFILYMDNELNKDQVKMVDAFLAEHPDLNAEFNLLMGAKLPLEEFSFDKKDLLAENMKLSTVDEVLLLYIDNELPANRKRAVEFELASNNDYQLQYQFLVKARLDPSEKIAYPNKKELYHRTERPVSIRVWLSVAAAVVIMALGGIIYFKNPPSLTSPSGDQNLSGNNNSIKNEVKPGEPVNSTQVISNTGVKTDVAVTREENRKQKEQAPAVHVIELEKEHPVEQKLIAEVTLPEMEEESPGRQKINNVQAEAGNNIVVNASKGFINTATVTSVSPERTMIKDSPVEMDESSNRKGSLKGFLRKATRMIEKRTGIDPTNANGDLLIGAVAINLK